LNKLFASTVQIEEELYNLSKLINKDEDEDEEARTQVDSPPNN
jgi:hypothetical protein